MAREIYANARGELYVTPKQPRDSGMSKLDVKRKRHLQIIILTKHEVQLPKAF